MGTGQPEGSVESLSTWSDQSPRGKKSGTPATSCALAQLLTTGRSFLPTPKHMLGLVPLAACCLALYFVAWVPELLPA